MQCDCERVFAGPSLERQRIHAILEENSEIETITENHFSDQMIGRAGEADAEAEIDLPLGG